MIVVIPDLEIIVGLEYYYFFCKIKKLVSKHFDRIKNCTTFAKSL